MTSNRCVEELARRHRELSVQISQLMGSGASKAVFKCMDERNQVAEALQKAGWSLVMLGANALGLDETHFAELVQEGTYALGVGAPESARQ